MMEWVPSEIEFEDGYVDDIIKRSTGETEQKLLENHERDVRAVLKVLREENLVVDPRKANKFMREVEFCRHILMGG